MEKYQFILRNKTDKNLDLTTKCDEIKEVIDHINDGKSRKKPVFVDVDLKFDRKNVGRNSFVVEAKLGERAKKSWRQKVGWFLANKKDMRNFCDKNGKMFKIK